MSYPLPAVIVDPQGVSTSVAITDKNGNTPTVYSDQNGVNTISLPSVITARTKYYMPGEGPWTFTPTANGEVTAATTLTLEGSEVATINVGAAFTAAQWSQLSGAYASNPVPSDVAPRTAIFDPERSVYNPKASALQKLMAALAAAYTSSGFCSILCLGDSTTEGYGAGTDQNTTSYPMRLKSLLINQGGVVDGGTGWTFANSQNSPNNYDHQWTLTNFNNPSAGFNWMQTNTNGATAVFTSTDTGVVLDFAYFDNGGTFTYSIDGGAATPVTPGGTMSIKTISVTGLTSGTHSVTLTSTSTSTFYAVAARVRHSASGLMVVNAGIGGSKTSQWQPGGAFYNALNVVNALDTYHATIISLGLNEQSTTQATFQSNLQTIIQNVTGSVILWTPPEPQTPGSGWSGIRTAYYNLSDSLGLPLIDCTDLFGSWATANTNGLRYDSLHLNTPGYQALARALAKLILG